MEATRTPGENLRNPALAKRLAAAIRDAMPPGRTVRIMHVCGSHEHAVQHWGLRSLLPEGLEIFAGPGCPVCVCPAFEIREALALAREGAVLATYGDMLRVPTPDGTLLEAGTRGADVRMVYGIMDAVQIARENPDRQVVFFSVGFETTAAAPAAMVQAGGLPPNFSLLTSHRLTPPAMELLLQPGEAQIDGFLAPGHVSVVVGAQAWERFPRQFGKPVVVAGFEPADILLALLLILRQMQRGEALLENAYPRAVRAEGNPVARAALETVFEPVTSYWRGIGAVPASGLALRPEWAALDARRRFGLHGTPAADELPRGCSCDKVMLGRIHPPACPLFGRRCTPETPYGPCMVSEEGTCLIWARFSSHLTPSGVQSRHHG